MATKKYVSLEKLGLYDEKIKKYLGDADGVVLQSAKDYADGLADNYDSAGSAASALSEAKSYADGKDAAIAEAKKAGTDAATAASVADGKAVAAQGAADAAQADVDALETYVGTIPEGATATNVVAYVQEKTSGIATEGAMTELGNRVGVVEGKVSTVEGKVATIEGDYLKAADKAEVQGNIDTLSQTHATDKAAIEASIKAITDDYLKEADKTALQDQITANANAIAVLTDGVDADKVDGVKDLIDYVDEHGAEVTGMKEDISKNATAIAGVAGRMDTAEGKITALEGSVATKVEVETYNAKVAELAGVDTALSGRIDALDAKFGAGEGSVEDMIADAIADEASRVDGELAKKVDVVAGKGLSTNDLTNELKGQYDAAYTHSQVAHAPANAQENVIETVKVNGSAVTVEGKAVNISVPTDNAQLANGAGYLVASDIANKADKATTLAGYGIANAYTATEVDNAIATAIGQFEECSEAEINALFA